ncbi:hypothetical protein [uncultured Cohaesibacter sp.]|nr:hypothetical protein [uncultured Cohaesibacter sp.]
MKEMTPDNFRQLGDYDGFKADFLKLNGFGLEGVDYQRDVDLVSFCGKLE